MDAGDDDLVLRPESGMSPKDRESISRIYPAVTDAEETPSTRAQFSIAALFLLTFFASLGLMASTWSNKTVFAGVLGVPALIAAFKLTFSPPDSWQLRTTNWGLILSYLLACIVAMLGS